MPPKLPPLPTAPGRLVALDLAQQAAGLLLRSLAHSPAPLRDLADQARRAACSAALNLAEGAGRAGRDRVQHYRIAYGSAAEASVAVELLAGAGAMDDAAASRVLSLLDRTRATTWRLIRAARTP